MRKRAKPATTLVCSNSSIESDYASAKLLNGARMVKNVGEGSPPCCLSSWGWSLVERSHADCLYVVTNATHCPRAAKSRGERRVVYVYEDQDTDASASTCRVPIGTVFTFVALALILVGSNLLVGPIDESTAERALQGLPILYTAFGTGMVAVGLFIRHQEPARETLERASEGRYQAARAGRPDLNIPPLIGDRERRESVQQQQGLREANLILEINKVKKRSACWRSLAVGVEICGIVLLFLAATLAAFFWSST